MAPFTNHSFRSLFLGLAGGALLLSAGCGGDKGNKPDTSTDGGTDASEDAETGYDGGGGLIPDAGVIAECEEGGNTFFYVLSMVDLGTNTLVRKTDPEAPNNVVPGLNIDATDNTEDFQDSGKCYKRQDYYYPNVENPTHTGIDNRMSNFIEDVADDGLLPGDVSDLIHENVNSGKLLLLVRVANVDTDIENPGNTDYFPTDDSCVNVDIVLGAVPPGNEIQVGEDGFLVPGQSFDTQLQSIEGGVPSVRLLGAKIHDGVLTGRANARLPIDLPTGDPEADAIRVFIENNKAEFKIDATSISEGLLGGTLSVADTVQALADYTGFPTSFVKPLIAKHADINPNQTGSDCSDISIGLVYSGVTAVDTGMTQGN